MKTALLILGALLFLVPGYFLGKHLRDQRQVDRIWAGLKAPYASQEVFLPEMAGGLPPAGRRYLLHALRPGVPLAREVELGMTGTFRTGEDSQWLPFEASQILSGGRGFVWRARIRMGRFLFLDGEDYYSQGRGRVRFGLFGFIPVARASGPAVDRSAAGRLLIETVLLPTFFLPQRGARWEGIDEGRARATLSAGGFSSPLTLTVGKDGALRQIAMLRYRAEKGNSSTLEPFGAAVDEERDFGGITIPARIRVGWGWGTEGQWEFFRARIHSAQFR